MHGKSSSVEPSISLHSSAWKIERVDERKVENELILWLMLTTS